MRFYDRIFYFSSSSLLGQKCLTLDTYLRTINKHTKKLLAVISRQELLILKSLRNIPPNRNFDTPKAMFAIGYANIDGIKELNQLHKPLANHLKFDLQHNNINGLKSVHVFQFSGNL